MLLLSPSPRCRPSVLRSLPALLLLAAAVCLPLGCGGGEDNSSGTSGRPGPSGEAASDADKKAVADTFEQWRLRMEQLDWRGAFELMTGELPRSRAMAEMMVRYTGRYPTQEEPPGTGTATGSAADGVWLEIKDWPLANAVTAAQVNGEWRVTGFDFPSSRPTGATGQPMDETRRGSEPVALYSFLRDALSAGDYPTAVTCFANNSDGRKLAGLFAALALGPAGTLDYHVEVKQQLGKTATVNLAGRDELGGLELEMTRDGDDWQFTGGLRDPGGSRTLDSMISDMRGDDGE